VQFGRAGGEDEDVGGGGAVADGEAFGQGRDLGGEGGCVQPAAEDGLAGPPGDLGQAELAVLAEKLDPEGVAAIGPAAPRTWGRTAPAAGRTGR
jgi:hypothetical protein